MRAEGAESQHEIIGVSDNFMNVFTSDVGLRENQPQKINASAVLLSLLCVYVKHRRLSKSDA